MRLAVALAAGSLFGIGLAVSGMTDPARVLGFLDLAGAWDPTLAFVMAGALAVMAPAWIVARRRPAPALAAAFPSPPAGRIDAPLIAGAALFGAGWGLVGFCPGPAVAVLGWGGTGAWIFLAAMLAGMGGFAFARARLAAP